MNRRAFLKFSGLLAGSLVAMRYLGAQAKTAVRAVACVIMPGTEVPLAIPMVVGDDCQPAPTPEPSRTPTMTVTLSATPAATASPTSTATPSATASATGTPTMTVDIPTATPAPRRRTWLPWVGR